MGKTQSSERGRLPGRAFVHVARIAALVGSAMLAAGPAWAQPAEPAPQIAQQAITFDIAAQDLNSALLAFADRSNLQIFYDVERVRNLRSPGVRGTFTPAEGLAQLLAGTGMTFRFTGANTVSLDRPGAAAPGSSAVQLDPVQVEGQPSRNSDGTIGFVATRTRAATKTDTPILEIPQSVSVVTQEQMERRQTQSIDEALRYSPGVSVAGKEDNRFDYASARGFPLVQYLDGLRLGTGSFAASQTDPYLLQRIDILQGPASSLYGRSSPGGLIDMISKRPVPQRFGEIELQTGSFNRLQGAVDFGGTLDQEGKLYYRFTALARDADTQVDYIRNQRLSIAPSLTWKPDANTTFTLLLGYQNDPTGGLYGRLPALGSVTPAQFGYIPTYFFFGDRNINTYKRDQYSIGYQLEHRFDDMWTFRQNARYRHTDLTYNFLYATGYVDADTFRRNIILDTERLDTFAIDNQVLARFSTSKIDHELLLGFDYYQTNWNYLYAVGAGPNLDLFTPNYFQRITLPPISQNLSQVQNQTGLYGQDQINLGPLMLTLGGRYDWSIQKQNNWLTQGVTGQYDGAFTGRAGVNYLFDICVAPYVSYATSFEPVIGVDFYGNPFKPTTGQQFEVGIKYKPTMFNGLFTAAYFELTQQNVLTADPNPNHGLSQVQTGEIRSQGVQFSAAVSLLDSLNLLATYSYLDNKVTKSNAGLVGRMPAGVSPDLASLWADYTIQRGPLSSLNFGGGVRYTSWSFGDAANSFVVPGYTLVDLTLQYDLGEAFPAAKGARLALNANNVFDTTYVAGCSTNTTCYYGFRRNVLATLTYRW
jgi:iron complex outermembrane receptor protein